MQAGCQTTTMSVTLTIRNVPEYVRDELAERAAREGRSLQSYLAGELVRLAEELPVAQWVARVTESVERNGAELDMDLRLTRTPRANCRFVVYPGR